MALRSDLEYDPFGERKAAEAQAEKKRQKCLDESIEIKVKDCFEGKPHEDRSFFIKRRDLIDLINGSGALNDIQETCRNYRLMNMRF